MQLNPSLIPHSSEQHADWEKALHGGDDALLTQLAADDDPAAALLELESYINGIYRGSQSLLSRPLPDIRFVFSTSQYLTTYKGPRSRILEAVYNGFLANPVHIALYIGCSFADEAMNGLLREAFAEYPGRHHYALLKWPRDRKGREPDRSAIASESAKYLEFGVRPV